MPGNSSLVRDQQTSAVSPNEACTSPSRSDSSPTLVALPGTMSSAYVGYLSHSWTPFPMT